ncbi:AAA family ATPase [Histomonas meleagridis]|uniref:AAA family ATPase n=1 Tax=Histomonas meleagridis TaxID=135588 RepID=UPI00355A9967|nr:AAA family ATPase [Histomonas meleagridis]KAH0798672.1 AAA family ATPase [Histomonas meleagridis]
MENTQKAVVESIINKYAQENDGRVEFGAAFEMLRRENPKFKIGKNKFEMVARQVIQANGYKIFNPKTVPRPPPLLPRSPSQELQKIQSSPPEQEPIIPRYSYKDVGGLEFQKACLWELINTPVQHKNLFELIGVTPEKGVILHGPSGCGKSLLAEAAAGEFSQYGLKFFKIAATELISPTKAYAGQTEGRIKALFKVLQNSSPALLLIDNIEIVTNKKGSSSARIVSQLCYFMDEVFSDMTKDVFIIATTNHIDDIDPSLRRCGRFGKEISIGLPDQAQRLSIFQTLAAKVNIHPEVNLDLISRYTDGFVPADIISLVKEAGVTAVKRLIHNEEEVQSITMEDLVSSIPRVQPTLRREGFATLPPVSFDEIGGLDQVKQILRSSIIDAINNPDVFAQYGHRPSSGVVLYGPPGCGKTLLARALSLEANRAAFISVKGPELLNKYLGESESAIRGVFQRARDSAPCIIFFDEFDAICPRRSEDSNNQAASRVVNQLLTEMDGVEDRGRVFVIGATNRLELIDEAMLRPGRLDKKIQIPMPDMEARKDILDKIIKKIPLCESINTEEIAAKCEGFSGADLESLKSEAIEIAIRNSKEHEWIPVNQSHFDEAVGVIIESKMKVNAKPKVKIPFIE